MYLSLGFVRFIVAVGALLVIEAVEVDEELDCFAFRLGPLGCIEKLKSEIVLPLYVAVTPNRSIRSSGLYDFSNVGEISIEGVAEISTVPAFLIICLNNSLKPGPGINPRELR
jgi:hypothetical protein